MKKTRNILVLIFISNPFEPGYQKKGFTTETQRLRAHRDFKSSFAAAGIYLSLRLSQPKRPTGVPWGNLLLNMSFKLPFELAIPEVFR